MAKPSGGPSLEFEALLKVFFAEHARKEDVLLNVEVIRRWAAERNTENIGFARMYLETGAFPEGLASIV